MEKLVHVPAVVCHIEAEEEMGLEVLGQSNQTQEFTFYVWKWEEGAVVTMQQPFQLVYLGSSLRGLGIQRQVRHGLCPQGDL